MSDQDQDVTVAEPDQSLSEEQTYRETMRGIWPYIGWTHIPDMDTSAATSDDNPFGGPKTQFPGKVSVQMPINSWLCRKHNKLTSIWLTDTLPRSQRPVACLKISSLDQRSPKPSGTGCILTTRVTPLLCRLEVLMPHASIAVTVEFPDKPD